MQWCNKLSARCKQATLEALHWDWMLLTVQGHPRGEASLEAARLASVAVLRAQHALSPEETFVLVAAKCAALEESLQRYDGKNTCTMWGMVTSIICNVKFGNILQLRFLTTLEISVQSVPQKLMASNRNYQGVKNHLGGSLGSHLAWASTRMIYLT